MTSDLIFSNLTFQSAISIWRRCPLCEACFHAVLYLVRSSLGSGFCSGHLLKLYLDLSLSCTHRLYLWWSLLLASISWIVSDINPGCPFGLLDTLDRSNYSSCSHLIINYLSLFVCKRVKGRRFGINPKRLDSLLHKVFVCIGQDK